MCRMCFGKRTSWRLVLRGSIRRRHLRFSILRVTECKHPSRMLMFGECVKAWRTTRSTHQPPSPPARNCSVQVAADRKEPLMERKPLFLVAHFQNTASVCSAALSAKWRLLCAKPWICLMRCSYYRLAKRLQHTPESRLTYPESQEFICAFI